MSIIHIASIKDQNFSGVGVAVPQHVINQQNIEDIALINVNGAEVNGINNQFKFNKNNLLSNLPAPFNTPKLVVFHELYYTEYLSIYKQLNKLRIPYIIVPHGGLTYEAQKIKAYKKVIANKLLFNDFFRHAKAIHFLSQKEEQNSLVFNNDRFVIPNGVKYVEGLRNHKINKVLNFVYIGRYSMHTKGLDLLIEGVRQAVNNGDEFSIKMYGPKSEDYNKIQEMVNKYSLDAIIKLNQQIIGLEKTKVLEDSDFFIQTSRSEGMSMGVLEALSLGVPCCLTEGVNLTNQMLKYQAGYVCKIGASDIANMIHNACSFNGDYLEVSKNAKLLIKENYSWDIITDCTINKYKEYF